MKRRLLFVILELVLLGCFYPVASSSLFEQVVLRYHIDPMIVKEINAIEWDIDANGTYLPRNQVGQYINIRNGYRVTTRNLYLFGNSEVFGVFVADDQTIASYLQCLMPGYRVFNVGIVGVVAEVETIRLKTLPLHHGDIVVFLDGVQDIDRIYFGTPPDVALREYTRAIDDAARYSRLHGAAFYHFRQPAMADHAITHPGLKVVYDNYWSLFPGALIQVNPDEFYDFAHTTARGNAAIARAIYQRIDALESR